ncbi:transmembrane protein 39A [Melanaphis sacchari]|uniref:transmembrane protein 39A n=1 Tax=Melanaphis sacchari TaxID=742174 RepID=UPI000DC13558|nr:transmembrane protein 39A [Melanaphis sacchari]
MEFFNFLADCLKKMKSDDTLPRVTSPRMYNDGNITFEGLMVVFASFSTYLQYLNIYRSVWWLPNSNYTLWKIHLIDYQVVIFILAMHCRRFIYCLITWVFHMLCPQNYWKFIRLFIRLFVSVTLFLLLALLAFDLYLKYDYLIIMYLFMPIIGYLCYYGFKACPFFDMMCISEKEIIINGKPLIQYTNMHICTSNPKIIRSEVENMRDDFNNRLTQILFSSFFSAYYACFLPLVFVQTYVVYEEHWVLMHFPFVMMTMGMMLCIHYYPVKYFDHLHKAAMHLGRWKRVKLDRPHLPIHLWSEEVVWQQGSLVRHNQCLYKAEGVSNVAEPGKNSDKVFYRIFSNPSETVFFTLASMQVSFMIVLIIALIISFQWHHIFYLSFVMLLNYVTLCKTLFNYRMTAKIYKLLKEKTQ